MKIVRVKFENYYRVYSYKTKLSLRPGAKYKITADGQEYGTPVRIIGYTEQAPFGIELKEICGAEEVEENE